MIPEPMTTVSNSRVPTPSARSLRGKSMLSSRRIVANAACRSPSLIVSIGNRSSWSIRYPIAWRVSSKAAFVSASDPAGRDVVPGAWDGSA